MRYMLRAPEAVEPFVAGEIAVGSEFVDVVAKDTPGEEGDDVKPLHLTIYSDGKEESAGCTYRFIVTDSGGHATDAIDPTPLPDVPRRDACPSPTTSPRRRSGRWPATRTTSARSTPRATSTGCGRGCFPASR